MTKKKPNNVLPLVDKKIEFFENVIQKTASHVQKNKKLDILGISDINTCIEKLSELSKKIEELKISKNLSTEIIINTLQTINNELSCILKIYGTENFEDLTHVCFGNNKITTNENEIVKYELIKKYFHPICYKVISKKEDTKNNETENKFTNLACFDVALDYDEFHIKVYGIKLFVYSVTLKKSILITGIVDDIFIEFLNDKYIKNKIKILKDNTPPESEFNDDAFNNFILSLSLKDFLIYETNNDIYNKFLGTTTHNILIKQKQISHVVKDFIIDDMYGKRNTLISLLICSSDYENQYLAYLLYDLLSNDLNGKVDTQQQTILFDSLPWNIKQLFKCAMKKTIQYTNELSNFDINKIPLEQQICLIKANDTVKEKAMMKLKEVKSKSEDSGSKARQFLDGLLKIPFGVYKKEPILNIMDTVRNNFKEMYKKYNFDKLFPEIEAKNKYTSIEILKYIKKIQGAKDTQPKVEQLQLIKQYLSSGDKAKLIANNKSIDVILKKHNVSCSKYSNLNKESLSFRITDIINHYSKESNEQEQNIIADIIAQYNNIASMNHTLFDINDDILQINTSMKTITDYMSNVKSTLDKSVHGHDKAKKQIERIIGQWINGEQDGYCFGFEGPPGVGKCFAKNTPIMLYNGDIKMVQDITTHDKLMGDDSKPRNVLALGKGKEKMYKIEQAKGETYVVNESHILSLKMSKEHLTILGKKYFKDDIIDICIKDYLSLPRYLKSCLKGYKVDLKFEEQPTSIEPYALGFWLANDFSSDFVIKHDDEVIVNYFQGFAEKNGLTFRENKIMLTTKNVNMHILIDKLQKYDLINNKHIPKAYKCNSKTIRLELLAGLIDCSGRYNKYNNSFEITQKQTLVKDILWLVRSLGFKGEIKDMVNTHIYKRIENYEKYNKIIITGNFLSDVPCLLERKKPVACKQKRNYLNTMINVIPLNEGEYFGFQIDGNSRFLLGDFTVTHNTSLAKRGLSDCLKDDKGISRPFAMIQMGGDSNGSTLHGHNYTYVGSTWGSIVQILIDKKCMNPIIFIDEVDKISRTEHGKEIVGILTHLLDPTQNDCFQDKYFTGVDFDLSKALFILSYNDVEAIDKILLDRIHRIKFSNLSLEDKIIICNTHVLPDVYKKMGLEDMIHFNDNVLKFIIDEYTCESGVRKLKEILFEIVGEINLDILKNNEKDCELPIKISISDIKTKYFKDKDEVKYKKIHTESQIGVINGLWANSIGKGGVIQIQVDWRPSDKFLSLHLTGMQGDVMKESMNVALTLAWSLTPKAFKKKYIDDNNRHMDGIHIHCPEGSTPKDGPSAGTAITTAIYSVLNKKKIKHNIAITGEICLNGNVTEIGGLDLKIIGAIKAGVKEILFPVENLKDYNTFIEKHKTSSLLEGIIFHPVNTIKEVFDLVFDD